MDFCITVCIRCAGDNRFGSPKVELVLPIVPTKVSLVPTIAKGRNIGRTSSTGFSRPKVVIYSLTD